MRDAAQPARVGNATLKSSQKGSTALLLGLALTDFVAHMLVSANYGYFRDELYYIEAGRHLTFGYVDFPPLIALVARLLGVLAGDALWAIHVVPALATALIVLLTGLMTRELGGRGFAQALAALASLVAVTFLAIGSIFSMDALDELWWIVASYVAILILKRDRPRLWFLFGAIVGVGLMTKVTMLFFGFAIAVGLLLTPARRHFRAKWIWLGGAIALERRERLAHPRVLRQLRGFRRSLRVPLRPDPGYEPYHAAALLRRPMVLFRHEQRQAVPGPRMGLLGPSLYLHAPRGQSLLSLTGLPDALRWRGRDGRATPRSRSGTL
jgi:hypothetical protein